jgi:hypothetical protein
MLDHPPPTKVRSDYFYSFWNRLHEVAHNYYPAEASPELQGKKKSGADNEQALAIDGAKDKKKRADAGQGGKGGSPSKELCRKFAGTGKCVFGDGCRFKHENQTQDTKTDKGDKKGKGKGGNFDTPCFHFRDTGKCPYGDKCRFNHVKGPALGGQKPPAGGGAKPP